MEERDDDVGRESELPADPPVATAGSGPSPAAAEPVSACSAPCVQTLSAAHAQASSSNPPHEQRLLLLLLLLQACSLIKGCVCMGSVLPLLLYMGLVCWATEQLAAPPRQLLLVLQAVSICVSCLEAGSYLPVLLYAVILRCGGPT